LLIVVDQRAVQAFAKQGRSGTYFPILASTAVDPNHNTTRIEFSNAQVNRGPADSVFSFTPPPGVEVVSPTLAEPGT
jgi:outer membrane lipoprotein carrier protein